MNEIMIEIMNEIIIEKLLKNYCNNRIHTETLNNKNLLIIIKNKLKLNQLKSKSNQI